ncbi:MAG: hypothetical protein QG604_329 [Candidatus Dependentiae bacterium]|nr:hypothetical protein [Candidatus Dependentiae bacterium]
MRKIAINIAAILILSCSIASTAWTNVNFGSRESGFVVSAGTLALGGATLVDGSLRDVGGSITGTSMDCTGITFEAKDGTALKRMTADGTVTIGSAISLGNNDKLLVAGGTVAETITVAGATATPSIIEGFGSFAADISVSDAKQLNLRWTGPLNKNLSLNAGAASTATVKLEQDLTFAAGIRMISAETGTDTLNFNGRRVAMGGDAASGATSISTNQTWTAADVLLTGPVSIASSKTVTLGSAAMIEGNGNRLSFNSGSILNNATYGVTLNNVVLGTITSASFAGSGTWTCVGATFETSAYSITVDGSIVPVSSAVDIFGGAATFGTSRLALNKDVTLGGTWTIADSSGVTINGRGNVFSGVLSIGSSSTLSLENMTVAAMASGSIATTATGRAISLSDVQWYSSTHVGAIYVRGTSQGTSEGAATLTLPANTVSAGNIFAESVTWSNGVNLELLSDVTISGSSTWSFSDNSVIDGNGHHLDLAAGTLSVANGKTLTLRNVVLDNVVTASLADVTTGTVNLSNVTIILGSANVAWGAYNTCLVVDGSLYVVTGSYTLTVPNSAGTSVLNGVTAYYDTLSAPYSANLVGFTGTGRVMFVDSPNTGNITLTDDADLDRTEYLFPADDGVAGRTITFDGSTIAYNGHGRSLMFPYTTADLDTQVVFTVTADTGVNTSNIVFEGVKPAHLNVVDANGLCFGNNTTVRLHEDWTGSDALATEMIFGSSASATGEVMVLDLNGKTIDMSSSSALIQLLADLGGDSSLYIKNGRLINIADDGTTGPKIIIPAGSTLYLENVQLGLNDDFTFADASLVIQGHCVISGVSGKVFDNTSADDFVIQSNARLTLMDGVVYDHNNAGTINFVTTDATSVIELIGATFRRHDLGSGDPLALTNGTMIVDHKSYIQPGSKGIDFGTDSAAFNIEIRPGATINVGTGTGATAGSLTHVDLA